MGTRHATAFVQIPLAAQSGIAENNHRNFEIFHRPEKAKLLVLGLDRAGIEHKIADTGVPAKQFRVGGSDAWIDAVRDHPQPLQREFEPPRDLLGLDIRAGQQQVYCRVKLALPGRRLGKDRTPAFYEPRRRLLQSPAGIGTTIGSTSPGLGDNTTLTPLCRADSTTGRNSAAVPKRCKQRHWASESSKGRHSRAAMPISGSVPDSASRVIRSSASAGTNRAANTTSVLLPEDGFTAETGAAFLARFPDLEAVFMFWPTESQSVTLRSTQPK